MSGIGEAGLALAVFPILVDGLTHIVAGIKTMRRWRRYKLIVVTNAEKLESAYAFFWDTLEELLRNDIQSEEDAALMLEDPGGTLWKKPEYEEKLRRRLGRSYSSYMKTIVRLRQSLEAMCEKLGVDPLGRVQPDDFSITKHYMQRIKITFSEDVYAELLKEIRQANGELWEIAHRNSAPERMKRGRQSRRRIVDLKLVRKHAASLYQVLMNDKVWKCQCKAHHRASLRLEARPQTIEEGSTSDGQENVFRILLSLTDNTASATAPTRWEDIEIIPSLTTSTVIHQPEVPPSPTRPRRSVKGVSFAVDPDTNITSFATTTAAILSPPNKSKLHRKYIKDICSALCGADQDDREIGLVLDDADKEQQHRLYRADTIKGTQNSSKSLEDLLKTQRYSSDEDLSRGDRLRIAVVLASSVLQLDGTSWLKSGWSSVDIFFHYKDGRKPEQPYPFLAWQQCCNSPTASMGSLRIRNTMIRSQTLLDLGLTLVELCFGRTLANMRKAEDGEPGGADTRFKTATRLHKRVYNEMGLPYGDVVRRCLFQLFDVRDLSLHLEEVQQKVLDDVVTPLADDLNNFNGHLKIR